jgi:DNA-directed RNA polymerase subunit L
MHCDSIVEFVSYKVQHVVACIANIVIQVHGLMNQKYELIVTNGIKPKDITTFSLWNLIFLLTRS